MVKALNASEWQTAEQWQQNVAEAIAQHRALGIRGLTGLPCRLRKNGRAFGQYIVSGVAIAHRELIGFGTDRSGNPVGTLFSIPLEMLDRGLEVQASPCGTVITSWKQAGRLILMPVQSSLILPASAV